MAVHRDSSGIPDRVPPQSVDLEMCVLGGIMLDPVEALGLATDFLVPESFYLEGHELLFHLMIEMNKRGIPPDMNALLDELRSRELLDKVGGSGVVMGMLNSVPTAANVEYHAKKLADKYALRQIIKKCIQIIDRAYMQEDSASEILAYAAKLTADEAAKFEGIGKSGGAVDLIAVLDQYMGNLSDIDVDLKRRRDAGEVNPQPKGSMLTKFYAIDHCTGGLRRSELTIVGAQSSVGKTALMMTLILHMCVEQSFSCLLISLEMSFEQLAERFLAMGTKKSVGHNITGVSTTKLRAPDFSNEEWVALTTSYESLVHSNIKLLEDPYLPISRLRGLLRQEVYDFVCVDYLHLMPGGGEENVTEKLSAISRGLKLIAREFNIPVVALSQMVKPVRGKEFTEPYMTDLLGAGAIAQNADNVWLLWKGKDEVGGILQEINFKLAKNRNGPLVTTHLKFYPEITLFLNPDRQQEFTHG